MKSKRYILCFVITAAYIFSSFAPNPYEDPGIKRVVIDAGHGGKDPGCHGLKTKEKDVALAVSMKLGKYIEQNMKDVEVIYTRRDDNFIELHERAHIANKNRADLFICIHCNSSRSKASYGAETFIMGLHKSEANLSVAKRENASVLLEDNYEKNYDGFDPNSPLGNIIFEMYQNVYLEQSLKLAAKVQDEFVELGRRNRGVKQAGFLVLYKTTMPSILVETGFLTNKEEELFLSKESNQDKVAFAIFEAFKEYKRSVEGVSGDNPDTDKNDETKPVIIDPGKEAEEQKNEKQVVPDNEPVKDKGTETKTIPVEEPAKEKHEVKIEKPVEPEVGSKEKVNTDVNNISAEVVFRVQITASDKEIPANSEKFKGADKIWSYQDNGMHKYTAGVFDNLDDAGNYQNELREKGFKGAFVVAFHKGNRIDVSEALKLLKK